MIKTILFDVDGVLIGRSFSRDLARDYSLTIDTSAPLFRSTFRACLVGKADLKQELGHYLPQWGWKRSVDEFLSDWFRCEDQVDKSLISRIQQFRQRGIPCYLATNQEKYRTEYILNHLRFAEQFDGTFSSAYVGYVKHESAFFEYVLRVLKDVKAEEILFWDDTVENVVMARQVGLYAEVYTTLEDFEKKVEEYLNI